jgi:hypothetical protein
LNGLITASIFFIPPTLLLTTAHPAAGEAVAKLHAACHPRMAWRPGGCANFGHRLSLILGRELPVLTAVEARHAPIHTGEHRFFPKEDRPR